MERAIVLSELEALVAAHAGPTLAGAKPGSLFTFCGRFAVPRDDDGASVPCRCDAAPAAGAGSAAAAPCSACDPYRIRARKEALAALVASLDARLAATGVRVAVLAWRTYGALIYLYRPVMLASYLADARVRRALSAAGYAQAGQADARDLVEELRRRFAAGGVPHEVGFFLGYPYADVVGFIENQGEGCLCAGCWKVYADVRRAMRLFSRYRRLRERSMRLFVRGVPLATLAAPGGFAGAA